MPTMPGSAATPQPTALPTPTPVAFVGCDPRSNLRRGRSYLPRVPGANETHRPGEEPCRIARYLGAAGELTEGETCSS